MRIRILGILFLLLATAVYLTPRTPVQRAEAVTVVPTFFYTGTEVPWAVPAGVTQIHVVAVGARGGDFFFPENIRVGGVNRAVTSTTGGNNQGGLGARVTADVPIPTGVSTIFVAVGRPGATGDTIGSFNGGGPGGSSNQGTGTSGGGASDIRTVSRVIAGSVNSRLTVAGGGGGGGMPVDGPQGGGGGDAGNPASAGADGGSPPGNGKGGGPGTLLGGGSGGAGGSGGPADGASAILTGVGGAGGGVGATSTAAGGGGGGGYFGGGGGGGNDGSNSGSGGGGAGSSFVTNTGFGVSIVTAGQQELPSVTISYVLAPTVTKSFATSPIILGGATTDLTINIVNPNAADALTAVSMTDALPANIRIAQTGAISTSPGCTVGTITAVVDTSLITVSNMTLPANSTCTFVIRVKGFSVGSLTNTTSFVASSGGTSTMQASAPIAVVAPTETPTSTPVDTPTSTATATATSTATSTPSPVPTINLPFESTNTPTPIPPATPTQTPIFIPQAGIPTISVPTFQNPAVGGIFNPPPRTPTPRPPVQAGAVTTGSDPNSRLGQLAVPVIQPPRTGDAGLERPLTLRVPGW